MSHDAHHHTEEKKSINFLGPVIGGLVVWLIALIIETNLDEPKNNKHSNSENHTTQTEQTDASHH